MTEELHEILWIRPNAQFVQVNEWSKVIFKLLKVHCNNMSRMVKNEIADKNIISSHTQNSDFQKQQRSSIEQTVINRSIQLNNHFEQQIDLKGGGTSLRPFKQQQLGFQRTSSDKRCLDQVQQNEIEAKGNQNLPQNIYTQIQPGPTQQQLARLTKQQRQLLSQGKDIIGYIHSNQEEFYENFKKKEPEQMDQELRSLYLLRLYGGPFDYDEIQFIDGHVFYIEAIVNKAEQIVPRLKSLFFKAINFFIPVSQRNKSMEKERKYHDNHSQDQEESKNLKDQ